MSNAWIARNVRLDTKVETLAVAGEKTVVSREWKISGDMAYGGIRALVIPGDKAGTGTVSLLLQTKIATSKDVAKGSGNWVTVKTVSVTNSDPTYIIMNPNISGDEQHFPLGVLCRVVADCAAGTTIKVGDIMLASEA